MKVIRKQLSERERINAELCRRKLPHFIKKFWPIVDSHEFKSNWHIDCMSDHLVDVKARKITRLLINIPPRHMKSLQVSVFFPAWLWLDEPQCQFLCASYAQGLSTRDCQKSRRIIQDPAYQALIPTDENGMLKWSLRVDQNQKMRYENTKTGHRIATSVDGALTGDGGDIIMVDDPHNVREAESKAVRESCLEWWDEAMPTRLNDIKTGVFIVIMQRVHEDDLAGHILAQELGYEHLCLPARYEGFNRIKTSITGWTDPRTKIGEPLWENHYGDKALSLLEKQMTKYTVAGQLQQNPAPREGGLFKLEDWKIIHRIERSEIMKSVRYWDKAGTADGGDWTAGVLMHRMKDLSYVIEKMERGQWTTSKREKIIRKNCDGDNAICDRKKLTTWVEKEPGSSGTESAENTVMNLAPHKIKIDSVSGSKEVRADGLACQVEIRNVYLLDGDWVKEFKEEFKNFPKGKHDDQVDCCSGAFNKLAVKKKRAGGLNGKRDKEMQNVRGRRARRRGRRI